MKEIENYKKLLKRLETTTEEAAISIISRLDDLEKRMADLEKFVVEKQGVLGAINKTFYCPGCGTRLT